MVVRFHHWLLVSCIGIGILVSLPQFIHMADARYRGIPVLLSSDEEAYLARVQKTLLGRRGEGNKGIVEEQASEPGFQTALLEETIGVLFGWTGLRSAWVLQIMDFVVPAFLLFVLYHLFLTFGFDRRVALIGAILFCLLELYNLNRPIHQGLSFLVVCLSSIGMWKGVQGSSFWLIVSGVLLGLLFGIYLWGWIAAWCVWGVLLLLCAFQAFQDRQWREVLRFLVIGAIGGIVAIPFLWHMIAIRSHPAYGDLTARAGLIHWRLPESWPWSLCFLVMALCMFFLWWKRGHRKAETPLLAFALSAFLLLNQHLLHGQLILFRSHYLFFLVFTAVAVLLATLPSWRTSVVACAASVAAFMICAAMLTENRYVLRQFIPQADAFEEQHLKTLLPALDALETSVILSDANTSLFVTSHTQHYVAYNKYVVNTLMTDAEITERFCLTQAVLPVDLSIGDLPLVTQYTIQRDPAVREARRKREEELVSDACERVRRDPALYLQKYHVDYVLWDQHRRPSWNPRLLGVPLVTVASTDNWLLAKIDD